MVVPTLSYQCWRGGPLEPGGSQPSLTLTQTLAQIPVKDPVSNIKAGDKNQGKLTSGLHMHVRALILLDSVCIIINYTCNNHLQKTLRQVHNNTRYKLLITPFSMETEDWEQLIQQHIISM